MSTLLTKGPSGRRAEFPAPTGGIQSNEIVVLRSGADGWAGISINQAEAGETVVIEYGHQVQLPKTAGQSFGVGDAVYVNEGTGLTTSSGTGNTLIGAATEPAAGGDEGVWTQLRIP